MYDDDDVVVVVVVVVFRGWEDDGFGSVVTGRKREGTDTRAEKGLRSVRERVLNSFVSTRCLIHI